jgi:lipid A 3-O-deacylase
MIRKTAAFAAAMVFSFAAHALDGTAVEVGYGDDRTVLLRLSVHDRWQKEMKLGEAWRLAGYWDVAVAIWDNTDASTADIGLTPVFRFEREHLYVEAAIGMHLVQRRISQHRVFSTAFQFGDHIGIGMRGRDYDLGLALQHLSNASIRHPNPGINFILVRYQHYLR